MKITKLLISSLVLLLVGCEELGIDVEDLEKVVDELEVPEYNISIKGLDPIDLNVGSEFDLEENVVVEGIEEYELVITHDVDRKRPGAYVARYRVLVGDLVVYDTTREINVIDTSSAENPSEDSRQFLIHEIGTTFDKSIICDGIDDDCDGIEEDIDFNKEGVQFISLQNEKIAVFVVESHNIVNIENMRVYNQRKFSEQEINAIETAGDLYTMHKLIEVNPLATGGTLNLLKEYVTVSDEDMKAFTVINQLHLEALKNAMQYYYPEIGDEVLICFEEENISSINDYLDTAVMGAKEKANKTKCSNALRTYYDENQDINIADSLYLDRLRNLDESFRTDSFFDLSYSEVEEVIGRELSTLELRGVGGIDNDCDGFCEIDPFELLLGRFYTAEYVKYSEYLDVGEFIRGEYDLNYDFRGLETEVKPIRIEMAGYRYVIELEQLLGHELSDEQINAVTEMVSNKFKAGADLSAKVNLRGVNPLHEESGNEGSSPLFEEMINSENVREQLIEMVYKIYQPGQPQYGQMSFMLGRTLDDKEVEALLTMRDIHMLYYDNGGAMFLEASIDEIMQQTGVKLSTWETELLGVFQMTLQAQDYNSSRSNTDG